LPLTWEFPRFFGLAILLVYILARRLTDYLSQESQNHVTAEKE
jgi:hypothetical protein